MHSTAENDASTRALQAASSGDGDGRSLPAAPLEELMADVVDYAEHAKSENTLRAYAAGWRCFAGFCEAHGLDVLPARPETVALYLADRARRYSVSTLEQRLAAIRHVHEAKGHTSPSTAKPVRLTMDGIRRRIGKPAEGVAPLLTDDVRAMVRALPGKGEPPEGVAAAAAHLRGLRDRALILVGFAGAFRRSELAGLHVEHLRFKADGVEVLLPKSKTDQHGEGQTVGLAYGEDAALCPVRSLRRWLTAAGIEAGPVFRAVWRNGEVKPRAITGRTVRDVIKHAAEAAGLEAERYGGHSLRAGHITQAAMNDAPSWVIMKQSRHKTEGVFRQYIREAERFKHNSSKSLGL